jgi:serine/threonine protein kinase
MVHRDLNPKNILLSADKIIKLADFGLATTLITRDKEAAVQTLNIHGFGGGALASVTVEGPLLGGSMTLRQQDSSISEDSRPQKRGRYSGNNSDVTRGVGTSFYAAPE